MLRSVCVMRRESPPGSRVRPVRPVQRHGVSLLEAIIALAIVGATSAAALASAGAGVRAADGARRAHEVEALSQEQLARLALADEAALRALPDSLAAGRFAAPFDDYAWRIESRPDVRTPGLYRVRLEIAWDEGAFVAHSALYRPPLSVRGDDDEDWP